MTKSLLSFSDMFIGGNDFFIYSKVWNKIVSWDWFWFLSDCKSLTVLCFGLTDVKFSHFDIMINTKVRDEVVSWRRDRRFHSGLQLMTKLIFSFFKIGLCGNDFLISTKVWHEVVYRPCWLLPRWTGFLLLSVPRSSFFGWSVWDFRCSSIFRKEGKCDNADRNGFKHVNNILYKFG